MTVEEALKELDEYGFHIEQFEADKFMCYDTGLFGLDKNEDPFVIDRDGVLEIYKNYIK